MDYLRIYNELIESGRNVVKIKGVHETHHILPRSLGGTDNPENLTVLTRKGHVLAHHLLMLITTGEAKRSMQNAFFKIAIRNGKRLPHRLIALALKANSDSKLGNKNASGPRSEEFKEKMRGNKNAVGNQNAKGYKYTDDQRAACFGRINAKTARVICLDDGLIFEMMKDAAIYYGVHAANISKCCRGIYKTTGGLRFAYA